MELSAQLIDLIAQGLHLSYVQDRMAHGETAGSNLVLRRWVELDEELRESNREVARQLARRLDLVHIALAAKDGAGDAVPLETFLSHIDLLARVGHTRWVNQKLGAGWTYGAGPKDPEQRTHPDLVAWSELPEEEREKSRAEVRTLPRVLEAVGLRMVWSSTASPVTEPVQPEAGPQLVGVQPAEQLVEAHQAGAAELARVAKAMHEAYVRDRLDHGESVMENPALRPWERLTPDLHHANVTAARQIWARLMAVGYTVTDASHALPAITPRELAWHFETLAELGHTHWVNERTAAGWSYGKGAKDFAQKTHPGLINWERLAEEEKEKARQQVRDLSSILGVAGLKIVLAKVPKRWG